MNPKLSINSLWDKIFQSSFKEGKSREEQAFKASLRCNNHRIISSHRVDTLDTKRNPTSHKSNLSSLNLKEVL